MVTGANVHDSQAAIPLEKMTEGTVQHLYSVMDAAYDADPIARYIREHGRVNAHLKDWLIPSRIFVRGHKKVTFLILSSVVVLAAVKVLRYFILPTLAKA